MGTTRVAELTSIQQYSDAVKAHTPEITNAKIHNQSYVRLNSNTPYALTISCYPASDVAKVASERCDKNALVASIVLLRHRLATAPKRTLP